MTKSDNEMIDELVEGMMLDLAVPLKSVSTDKRKQIAQKIVYAGFDADSYSLNTLAALVVIAPLVVTSATNYLDSQKPVMTSFKFRNVVLNLRNISGMGDTADLVSLLMQFTSPLAGIVALVQLFRKVIDLMSIGLTLRQRDVLVLLWSYPDSVNPIEHEKAYKYYQDNIATVNPPLEPLTFDLFAVTVTELANLECLDLEDNQILLKEAIRKKQ